MALRRDDHIKCMTTAPLRGLRRWSLVAAALAVALGGVARDARAQEPGPPQEQEQEAGTPGKFPMVFPDARIEQVVASINESQPVKVLLFGKTSGEKVSIIQDEVTLDEALGLIARQKGWIYWKLDDGSYGLADRAYFEQEVLPKRFEQKVFQPRYLKASELQKAVQDLLTKGAASGSAIADDRTNKLIVTDLPVVLERIERLLREIDVQLITRVFRIRHSDVQELSAKLENYKSGPGTIEVDAKTRQIIVTDLFPNIKKMELLIDILDVGPEIVIYDVNTIGIDGKDLETLQQIIENIRTKDLLFEVNAKQGVFILEDVPSVQEKVEQILASFDRPVKQVQIQGEVIQTGIERTFGLGVDRFAYADDLLGSIAGGSISKPIGVTDAELATPRLGFTDIGSQFPVFEMTGSTITGQYLNNQVYVVASAVFSDTTTNILLQPNLLVKNQSNSRIFVGSETPFLTTFFNDNTTGGATRSQTQQRIPDGLEFEITPSISNSLLVELEIVINNDRAFVQGENQGITLIGRNRQNIETTLQIPSGQTRVIGGLISNRQSDSVTGVPFLAKLPLLGPLFGKTSTSENRQNLMLFITPTVVEDTIPRPTGTDGRRGRLVSEYERVGGGDLGLSPEAQKKLEEEMESLREQTSSLSLSGDAAEEMKELEVLRGAMPKDTGKGAAGSFADSNYTPAAGAGSGTSINTESRPVNTGGAGARGGQQAGQRGQPGAQPGQQGGQQQGRGGRGQRRPEVQPGTGAAQVRPETRF